MSTESMKTSLRRHADQEDLDFCNPEPYKRRGSFFGHVTGYYNSSNDKQTTTSTTEKSHDESWSIKKFLSRHVSRRYRVPEREPNRLRKRFTQ